MARTRILVRLAACCCFCLLALLPPPAHGRRPAGLLQQAAGGGGGGSPWGRRLRLVPVPEPRFVPAAEAVTTTKAARPAAAAAWSVSRPEDELRAVPGGPDPLHHHGGSPSRRPEQDRTTPSP